MSNHMPDMFYTAVTERAGYVPEQPETRPLARYADALQAAIDWASNVGNGDMTPEISELGTVTGDGSKGIGATELAVVRNCWRLANGRFISIYQIKS